MLALLAAPSADAAMFGGEVIDGPSPDIVSAGGLDVSRDGTGGVAYVRRDGGVEHAFVSRLVDGAFAAPERIDGAVAEPAAAPVIAAGDGGRLVAAWVGGATLYASVRPSAAAGWSAPQALGAPAAAPAVDLGVNGHAYVVWVADGDVRAARLERGATQLTPAPAPLDLDPARAASDPDVAVSGDGLSLIAWTETGADGAPRVIGQRLSSLEPLRPPIELSAEPFEGRGGGAADAPDVDIEEDSSFGWVAYRQTFADGQRGLARRLRGSRFEPPVGIDGQTFPAEAIGAPQIAVNGSGSGLSAVGRASGVVFSSRLHRDVFGPAIRLDAAPSPFGAEPRVVFGEGEAGFVAWPGADTQLRGREVDEGAAQAEVAVTNAALGPVDVGAGLLASAARSLDAAVVAVQGTGPERRLVAGMLDRPPGFFQGLSSTNWRRASEPLRWSAPLNLWGAVRYEVEVDGRVVGRSTTDRWRPRGVRDGQHRWRVVATDRRGQRSATASRVLRLDGNAPRASIDISRSGAAVTVRVRGGDGRGSGVASTRISFGDGSSVRARTARHVYRRGTYTIRVRVEDRVGNARTVSRRISVR